MKLHLRTAASTLSMGANSLDAEPLLPPLADALHSAPLCSVSSRGVQVPCAQLFLAVSSSSDVSARLAALRCAVNSTPSTLTGCLLFLRSPFVVVVHPR